LAAPVDFNVTVERDGPTLVVAPRGEIDLATVGLVREAVEREHGGDEPLVLDLRGVAFMDTSGLRFVLELSERSGDQGFTLRIVRGTSAVQRVFEVAGLEGRLPFVDDPANGGRGSG
jgi:anti-sigma B factor antagonist